MKTNKLRVHDVLRSSYANGPGRRFVVWVQGCTLACPGCFNPETHDSQNGSYRSAESLLDEILETSEQFRDLEGITISGGEPLQQFGAISDLLTGVRLQTRLSALLFTGFRLNELRDSQYQLLAQNVDVLVAGRYDQSKRIAKSLMGSSNKEVVFFTDRYERSDLDEVPEGEIIISETGELIVSGIEPLFCSDEVRGNGLHS